jgi:hypothetical protein
MHEVSRDPSIAAVAITAIVGETFMRRIEGMLNVVDMANDAVCAPNLYARVVPRAAGTRREEQYRAEPAGGQESGCHGAPNKHEFQLKRST